MSTAYFPQGMSSYNNRSQYQGSVPYVPWKDNGILSYPVGVTAGHIRPLTNNDVGNVFPAAFGKPRPIKHYRKGKTAPVPITIPNNSNPLETTTSISRNYNRQVKSSTGSSLGGGAGGFGMISQMIGAPGSFIVKQNLVGEINGTEQLDKDCKTCSGTGIVADYKPSTTYLTENPEPKTQTPGFCCNAERKALQRVIYASTNLKKNYFTTHKQYLQNRCQTYEQRVFNFVRPADITAAELRQETGNPFITEAAVKNAKPGSPLALLNTYVANCQPNGEIYATADINLINAMVQTMLNKGILTQEEVTAFYEKDITTLKGFINYIESLPEKERNVAIKVFYSFTNNPYVASLFEGPTNFNNPNGCKLVVYKPNNSQYAVQGAVSSSTRILKLSVTTIEKNLAGYKAAQKAGAKLNIGPAINPGGNPVIPFLYKNKAPYCTQDYYTNFTPRFQNPRTCSLPGNPNSERYTNPTKFRPSNLQPAKPTNNSQYQGSFGNL